MEGVNASDRIPNYVVVFIDDNLVVCADLAYRLIKWILNEITQAFVIKQDCLPPKYRADFTPSILVVKPLPKPVVDPGFPVGGAWTH